MDLVAQQSYFTVAPPIISEQHALILGNYTAAFLSLEFCAKMLINHTLFPKDPLAFIEVASTSYALPLLEGCLRHIKAWPYLNHEELQKIVKSYEERNRNRNIILHGAIRTSVEAAHIIKSPKNKGSFLDEHFNFEEIKIETQKVIELVESINFLSHKNLTLNMVKLGSLTKEQYYEMGLNDKYGDLDTKKEASK